MRTCPHCQFLVADGATTCSVCHRDLSAPREPAAVAGVPLVAPGHVAHEPVPQPAAFAASGGGTAGVPGAAVRPPPGGSWPPPQPGTVYPPMGVAPPRQGWSTTKILVVVGVILLVPVLGVAGLVVLGTTVEERLNTAELVADDLPWATHEDPDGEYAVDMPGRASVDTVEMPESYGLATSLETATVSGRDFGASVARTPDVVAQGQTFATMPFSPSAGERSLSDAGIIEDAEITDHQVVDGSGDLQMSLEVRGTVQGEQAVMWGRLVIVGTDLYEINAVGSLEDTDEVRAILDRMTSSFRPT
jgi:hypothetical protein